jgi:hypothetical protein
MSSLSRDYARAGSPGRKDTAHLPYSRSQIENLYNYISTQESHHKIKPFKEEYVDYYFK